MTTAPDRNANATMTPLLIDMPGNPVPDRATAGHFQSFDGQTLRYALFRCEEPVAKGTVVLLQGRNESIEKYFETIRDLTAMGLWVATYDMRGQGFSGRRLKNGRKGHVRRFSDYEKDLSAFLEKVVLTDARLPFYLVAHSAGALVALSAAPMLANRIERMVLAAPFVGIADRTLPPGLVATMARIASWTGLGGVQFTRDVLEKPYDGNPLTSDAQRFRRNQALPGTAPELGIGPPTARWLAECFGAIRRVTRQEHLTKITIPTLILAPTVDGVVPFLEQERLARRFRACAFIPIAGARHELFHERDIYRVQALAAIEAFIPGSDPLDMGLGSGI